MFLNLQFTKCVGKSYCANDTEFATWFLDAQVQFFYISSYFASENYTKPIRHFLDDSFWTLVPEYTVQTNILVRQSNVTLNDNLFGFIPSI
jgi:hypothetical protein